MQCAYHGWSFDATGDVHVPHADGGGAAGALRCAEAVPCREEYGLLWVLPDSTCKDPDAEGVPPPAVPDEFKAEGFKRLESVRDLPVDYSILMENIVDFDHGVCSLSCSSLHCPSAVPTTDHVPRPAGCLLGPRTVPERFFFRPLGTL